METTTTIAWCVAAAIGVLLVIQVVRRPRVGKHLFGLLAGSLAETAICLLLAAVGFVLVAWLIGPGGPRK
jgi:hypothetical protein